MNSSDNLCELERRFQALQADWRTACARVDERVAGWERAIGQLEREEAQLRATGHWLHGRGDFLGVLGRSRDELAHSRMIAWLLDPSARHGLGTRFLRGVLEHAFSRSADDANLARARTRCEVPLANGRLDIVVQAPNLHLVIENKVDADEGEDQCTYYCSHLDPDALAILLSPDGRRPKQGCRRFVALRYSRVAALLASALGESPRTAAGRPIAEDYLRTLRTEFGDA